MTIEQLTEQLKQRDAQIAELSQTVRTLSGQLEWCKRQLFGRKSERYEDPNQPRLFDGAAASAEDNAGEDGSDNQAASTITVPSHQRRGGGRGKRQPIPDHLRR